jgi:hypothetical protein
VYLEPEEQLALMEAAVAAGVPRHLAEGDTSRQVFVVGLRNRHIAACRDLFVLLLLLLLLPAVDCRW